MSYIPALSLESVDASVRGNLEAVQKKLGVLPNMFRTLAHSPVALNAYLRLSDVAGSGKLSARQREQIALIVGESNDCGYCVAAHGVIGKMTGLTETQIAQARHGHADNAADAAVITLARRIVEARGHVPTAELDAFKAAGFDDAAILEVLVSVALNLFTNYTNHLARTDIDFPIVAKSLAA
jgi:uncharacterized peroxidase-related enzyme